MRRGAPAGDPRQRKDAQQQRSHVCRIDLRCTAHFGAVDGFSARARIPMVAAVDQQYASHWREPPLVDHRCHGVVKAVVEQAG